MRRFCWRERSEKLNWRMLGALDVADVVRRGDPAVLEPYALHITFARLPGASKERDAWFLVRVLQLAMEYLLFMRARDSDLLEALNQEMRHMEQDRDGLAASVHKWKARARSGDKQVEKLHQVLQNIAKLLQIHGASPSAVATIETLLTELVAERRAKRKRRALAETDDEDEAETVTPAVQQARSCGFCGKLFSSAEYLEKHLVRRHGGESIEMETPMKHKMRQRYSDEVEDKENRAKNGGVTAPEAAIQKMVQQVERALHEHEEKVRSLAEAGAQKVAQIYERLHTETKLAEELKSSRHKIEQQYEESQRQLADLSLQKQKAEDDLADLKQQIQFLSLKKKMMGTAANAVLPTSLTYIRNDALTAAEIEIKSLHQTLETVNMELTSARQELAKVQALHLSALRKKKEIADKLALSREVSTVVRQENGSQTEQIAMVHETVQTNEQNSLLLIENEMSCSPVNADTGTDPVISSCEDVGIQTLDLLQVPPVETEVSIIDDLVPAYVPESSPVAPEPLLQDSATVNVSVVAEKAPPTESGTQKDDEHVPDYTQQLHSQDLLDTIFEHAQSAASKVMSSALVSRNYSSISRHKYVRSRFQHDEDVVKERVTSCLAQLEQFSRRFGVPAKSAWISEDNLHVVQQALHGHLEVLPTEVLSKMVHCEKAVNTIIEKEWVPMEKTRQEALDRFKIDTRAKSEISQGLVRQAMAVFGISTQDKQSSGATSGQQVVAMDAVRSRSLELPLIENKLDEHTAHKPVTNSKADSKMTPARRYSANNQLTVDVSGEAVTEGTVYLANDFVECKMPPRSDNFAACVATEVDEQASSLEARRTVDNPVESQRDETLNREDKPAESLSKRDDGSSVQSNNELPTAASLPLGESQTATVSESTIDQELQGIEGSRFPSETSTHFIRSIRVDAATHGRQMSSWETDSLARNHSGEKSASSVEIHEGLRQNEENEERAQWHHPRVCSSSDLGARISVHPAQSSTRSEFSSSLRPTDSLQSDGLSEASECAVIGPVAGLDHTQSIVMSSEMSFDTSILSLDASKSIEASTGAVVMDLVDDIDAKDEAEEIQRSASSFSTPAVIVRDAQNDSIMSFDDSDIEEVMLT